MRGLQTPDMTDPSADAAKPAGRLLKRADFLAAAKGRRLHGPAFSLQAAPRQPPDTDASRFGLTVTKKEGNAVVRNRLRRRLREVLRLTPGLSPLAGHDYVIVARRESLGQRFTSLQGALAEALLRIHAGRPVANASRRNKPTPPAKAATQSTPGTP